MVITAFGYSLSLLGYSLTRIVYPNTPPRAELGMSDSARVR
jgi:hypothetical protein